MCSFKMVALAPHIAQRFVNVVSTQDNSLYDPPLIVLSVHCVRWLYVWKVTYETMLHSYREKNLKRNISKFWKDLFNNKRSESFLCYTPSEKQVYACLTVPAIANDAPEKCLDEADDNEFPAYQHNKCNSLFIGPRYPFDKQPHYNKPSGSVIIQLIRCL